MTKGEATEKMKKLVKNSEKDPESAHADADELLCYVLYNAGYSALVKHYKEVKKWYS